MKKVIVLLFCGVSVLSLGVSELKADSCGIPPNFKCSCAKPVANIVNGKISISCGKTYCPQGRVCTDTGDCCPEITDCESVNGVTCKCDVCEDGTTKNSTEDKCCPIIANCSAYDASCGCATCADGYDLKDGKCQESSSDYDCGDIYCKQGEFCLGGICSPIDSLCEVSSATMAEGFYNCEKMTSLDDGFSGCDQGKAWINISCRIICDHEKWGPTMVAAEHVWRHGSSKEYEKYCSE